MLFSFSVWDCDVCPDLTGPFKHIPEGYRGVGWVSDPAKIKVRGKSVGAERGCRKEWLREEGTKLRYRGRKGVEAERGCRKGGWREGGTEMKVQTAEERGSRKRMPERVSRGKGN
jgi:hypothetical protein